MKKNPSQLALHTIALGIFLGISLVYFSPMLDGKKKTHPDHTLTPLNPNQTKIYIIINFT